MPRLIDSLLASDYPELEILVVDNGSSDGSQHGLPAAVRLVQLDENRGYAGAINAALRQSFAEETSSRPSKIPRYYLVLNNDVEIPPATIGHLVAMARRLGPGVWGPCIRRSDDPSRIEAAWGEVTWSHVLCRFHGKGSRLDDRWRRRDPVELLLGCALLIDRKVFETVGWFDERFFMYHEEVDFLYRVKAAGLCSYFCYPASVLHRGRHSTRSQPGMKTFWLRRNAVLFLRKYRPGPLRWSYFFFTLAASLVWNALTFRWAKCRSIGAGVWAGLTTQCCATGSGAPEGIPKPGAPPFPRRLD